jgi:pimeloyl-ACP methyl ester carboxylesterase
MLCDASLWDGVAPELLPHAGPRPGRIDLDGSVGEMAESVLAGAPDRFALAGHSLGAIVALEIMRRAPARVTRLALLNASARGPSEAQRSAWAGLRERVERGEFQATASDLARSNLPTERRSDAGMVERCERMAHAIGAAGLLRQLAAQDDRPDSRASLGSIRVPTLVLSGAQDEVCPPALQAELAAGIPGAEHVTVEGAGHMAALEEPEAVAGHLAAWLSR